MKISLYGCGGAGINIVSRFLKGAGKRQDGFALIEPYFIDTSGSNLLNKDEEIESRLYRLPDADGSGGVRRTNATSITERTNEILHLLKPADLSIVVHSTSGGSAN